MLIWFIYNLAVFFTALFVILEKSYGASIGLLAPLAWIILPITIILTIQWMAAIHWVIIDIIIILMSLLVILEKSFSMNIGFISTIAWPILIIMLFLIVKDFIFMRIKR